MSQEQIEAIKQALKENNGQATDITTILNKGSKEDESSKH